MWLDIQFNANTVIVTAVSAALISLTAILTYYVRDKFYDFNQQKFAHLNGIEIYKLAATSPDLTTMDMKTLMRKPGSYRIPEALSKNPHTSYKMLKKITSRTYGTHPNRLMNHPNMKSRYVNFKLLFGNDYERRVAAGSPLLSHFLMKQIASRRINFSPVYDQNRNLLRKNLANNPAVTADIIKLLLENDNDDHIAECLTLNSSLPYELQKLVLNYPRSSRSRIIKTFLVNPNIDARILEDILYDDVSEYIDVCNVLKHPKTTTEIIERFYDKHSHSKDTTDRMRTVVTIVPACPAKIVEKEYRGIINNYKNIDRNSSDPTRTTNSRKRLNNHYSVLIYNICGNPNLKPETLSDLYSELCTTVDERDRTMFYAAIRNNPNTDQWVKDIISLSID